jgi:hypothetical protein
MKKIILMLDDAQIETLKRFTVDQEEPESNWKAAAQILLNQAISEQEEIL